MKARLSFSLFYPYQRGIRTIFSPPSPPHPLAWFRRVCPLIRSDAAADAARESCMYVRTALSGRAYILHDAIVRAIATRADDAGNKYICIFVRASLPALLTTRVSALLHLRDGGF